MLTAHLVYFTFGFVIMWFASGLVVAGIGRFAKSVHVSAFASSFLILGVLTSLTEISVGLNSVLEGKPSIFVGNLIGGSFVILLLIIPILAIFNNGISFRHRLDQKRLLFFLVLIAAPSFVTLDGEVSIYDGLLVLAMYGTFFYVFQRQEGILDRIRNNKDKHSEAGSISKIIIGAVLIYFAGKILVDQTIFLAEFISVPPLLVSLLVLSLGTNIPELMITAKSIKQKHSEIAFGDYIGSAATNAMLFGVFTLMNGSFLLETRGFTPVFFVIVAGYVLFFIFSRIKNRLSPLEGMILILVYLVFLLFQAGEIASLSPRL